MGIARTRGGAPLLSLAAGVAALMVAATSASADVPRSMNLATHGVGSLYNALGTGIATVLTRHTNAVVRVQPFAGPPAWLPSMNEGATHMGILTGADAAMSWQGIGHYKQAFKNTRVIVVGGALRLSYYVAKDAPIKTVADLKGKRVPYGFAATPIVGLSSRAGLATAGLGYDDVVPVPVSNLGVGNQAFMEGRLDAGWHSVGSPAVQEADARMGGVRFISVIDTKEGAERMANIYPGSYPSTVKAGSRPGVVTDTAVLTNDIYLVGASQLSDEAAYTLVKTLWEKNDELHAGHPELRQWTRERMTTANLFMPYHDGAVRFFKEQGVWNEELEAAQKTLLAQ